MTAIRLLAAAAVVTAALIPTASASEVTCNAGFVLLNGNTCIKVFTNRVTWDEAKTACSGIENYVAAASHLAFIEECSLLNSLWTYIYYQMGVSEYLWLGGTDSGTEGAWLWLNGEAVPEGHPYWHTNQPDGGTLENKLVLTQYGSFADAHDDDRWGYICQYTP